MKANQKFRGDDEAVSPVIAVILMVAITVVLAATVYVWVSGFGSNSNSSPAHTLSLSSAGALADESTTGAATGDVYWKNYTVSSADPTLTYGDIKVTVGGTLYTFDNTAACDFEAASGAASKWGACAGSTTREATDTVQAGDKFTLTCYEADADCLSDEDFLILDVEANSVMVTLKVR